MASRADVLLRVALVAAVVVVIAAAQSGGVLSLSPTPTPAPGRPVLADGGVPGPIADASSNIPDGPLVGCPGRVIATETAEAGERGALTLRVFSAPERGGRVCATVTRTGTARVRDGRLTVSLRLRNYDGRRWPRYAVQVLGPPATRSDAVYLDDVGGRCVRAHARFDADRGPSASVTAAKVGCA